MSRIGFYVAMVAIVLAVRSSQAANCTSNTYTQSLDAIKLKASQIIVADYVNTTKAQILQQLKNLFNDTVVGFDYTATQTGDSININYTIVSACNETTTTVTSDGTQKTTSVTSSVNQAQAQKCVAAGL
jgi:general stress protein CsbA